MGPSVRSSWLLAACIAVPCGHVQESRPNMQPATRPAPDTVRTLTRIDATGKRDDKPNGQLTLIVWMPAAPLPGEVGDHVEVAPLSGHGPPTSFSSGKVFVRQGGRYQLRVATPDGYETIPDREVTVKDGEVLRVEIALRRQK